MRKDEREGSKTPYIDRSLVTRVRAALPVDGEFREACKIFGALGNRNRLRLLLALRSGDEICVCDVAHVLDINVSSASQHLRKLREVRILKSRNEGKMTFFSLRGRFAADLIEHAMTKAAPKASTHGAVGLLVEGHRRATR